MAGDADHLALPAAASTGNRHQLLAAPSRDRGGGYRRDFRGYHERGARGVLQDKPVRYLAGANALGLKLPDILFVAGSAHDVPGAAGAGMKVYWSNRQDLLVPADSRMPLAEARDLNALPQFLSA